MPPMPCSATRRKGERTIATTTLQRGTNLKPAEDRYSRQRMIARWDQERAAKARLLVAGAGALGNEVLKNLALIGIGNIVVIDFETVEIPNLARSILFRREDLGKPKI